MLLRDEPEAVALPRTLLVLIPPDHLHTNAEIAAWYLARGRRVVMPRKHGEGCDEITLDFDWETERHVA